MVYPRIDFRKTTMITIHKPTVYIYGTRNQSNNNLFMVHTETLFCILGSDFIGIDAINYNYKTYASFLADISDLLTIYFPGEEIRWEI